MDLFEFETKASHQGFKNIAGIDEAGRGPLAGPVVAAAVIFPSQVNIPGLNDSKKLSTKKREELFPKIQEISVTYSVAVVGQKVIDNINIVPNPYYAFSEYEEGKRDNRVKITNLPERCEITIFNMQGALVRSFVKDDPLTSIDWDLRNHQSIPIAGGMYIIHIKIEIPDETGALVEHEKILKWFGALRQPDLDNL